jgi:Zn-dependent oligopeptidase
VEAEIARILGKPNWNEVVLEARSAVTGKSKEAVIEEMENRIRERNQASAEALARRIEDAISGKNRPGKKPPTMRRAG